MLLAGLILGWSGLLFASGGVHCQKVEDSLPPVGLSWGVGHVEGSGRISPYRLTLSGREIFIVDPDDPIQVQQVNFAKGERLELREVGYWNDGAEVKVRLADLHASKTQLHLEVKIEASAEFQGLLTISDALGVSMKDVIIKCVKE